MADEKQDLTGYWNARFDRIEAKMDKLGDGQGSMNATLAGQAVAIEEHIRRTEILEEKHESQQQKVEAALAPLKAHVAFWGFLGKVLAAITAAGTLALAVVKIYEALH